MGSNDLRYRLQCLFGIEMEHAIFGFDHSKRPVPQQEIVGLFMNVAARLLKGRALPFRGAFGGLVLDNGGRLYADSLRQRDGQLRAAIEYATPEQTDPVEAVASCRYGQRLLLTIASEVEQCHGINVELYGPGVCPLTGNSTGCHLSFYRENSKPPIQLASHFASLVAISGSGGLNGLTFVRSPRAELISREVSSTSSGSTRGLIDDYVFRPLSSIGTRYQDINSDGGSDPQLAVRVASTALLLRLQDAGLLRAEDIQLVDPVGCVRAFNRTPGSKQRLTNGRETDAFELQKALAERVADQLSALNSIPWAENVLELWGHLIAVAAGEKRRQQSEHALSDHIQRQCFEAICERYGVSLSLLSKLDPLYAQACNAGFVHPLKGDQLKLQGHSHGLLKELQRNLECSGLEWQDFQKLAGGLLPELRACSVALSRIGPEGLMAKLQQAGIIDPLRISRARIDEAGTVLPPTRARLRADFVRQFAGQDQPGCAANWSELIRDNGQTIPLPDPYMTTLDGEFPTAAD